MYIKFVMFYRLPVSKMLHNRADKGFNESNDILYNFTVLKLLRSYVKWKIVFKRNTSEAFSAVHFWSSLIWNVKCTTCKVYLSNVKTNMERISKKYMKTNMELIWNVKCTTFKVYLMQRQKFSFSQNKYMKTNMDGMSNKSMKTNIELM